MQIGADTVKGFQDYLPPESLKRDAIKKIVEKNFKRFGFVPIETPLIEYDELMKPDAFPTEQEDEAISDRFRLRDKGGRNLGLRYEFTFQLARILRLNPNLKLPFRRYQMGEVFRDEPLRLGRTRQFTQCDIDILGDSSIGSDAECLATVSEVFKELKIKDFKIKINNRKLLNAIIESVEIPQAKQVMRELDKLDKIGEDQVKVNLKRYADSNRVLTLFKLLEKPLDFFIENAFDGAKEIEELMKRCADYKISPVFTPSMVRGFAYYTGNVFEIVVREKTAISGGGRYDKTVGRFLGREVPAVGISFSLEALMSLCPDEISQLELESLPKVLLISINQSKQTILLAMKLRKEDISCTLSEDKVGKSLEYANSLQIPYAILIGEEEIQKKKFKLKNMSSGEEKSLTELQLIKALKKV